MIDVRLSPGCALFKIVRVVTCTTARSVCYSEHVVRLKVFLQLKRQEKCDATGQNFANGFRVLVLRLHVPSLF